jgi:anti-anti-sigma regulatory factor
MYWDDYNLPNTGTDRNNQRGDAMSYSLSGAVLKLEGVVAQEDYMMAMSLHSFIQRGRRILKVDAAAVEDINATILLMLDSARDLLQQSSRNLVVENPSPRFLMQMRKADLNFSLVKKGQIVELHEWGQFDVIFSGNQQRDGRM